MKKKKTKKVNKIKDVKKKAKAISSNSNKRKIKDDVCKAYGDPQPVKICRPVKEFYNTETGEIYPKIFFRKDSWWDKIKRFFGYIP